jgi:hypothetical protein
MLSRTWLCLFLVLGMPPSARFNFDHCGNLLPLSTSLGKRKLKLHSAILIEAVTTGLFRFGFENSAGMVGFWEQPNFSCVAILRGEICTDLN